MWHSMIAYTWDGFSWDDDQDVPVWPTEALTTTTGGWWSVPTTEDDE